MSENGSQEQDRPQGVDDEQLPPDLVPGDDNPLAEALPDGEQNDLLSEGKPADESAGSSEESTSAEDDGEPE